MMGEMRQALVDLLGHVDEYIADAEHEETAGPAQIEQAISFARSNADLREEMLRRRMMSATALDEANMLSHAELDRLADEGLLEEAALELSGKWNRLLHPRGRAGQWIDTPDKPEKHELGNRLPVENPYREHSHRVEWQRGLEDGHAGRPATPKTSWPRLAGAYRKGHEVGTSRVEIEKTWGGEERVTGPEGEFAVKPTEGEAERAAADMVADEKSGRTFEDVRAEPFDQDPWLVTRVREAILSGKPTTRDKWSKVVNSVRLYSPEREAVHKQIIDEMLAGHAEHHGDNDKPKVFFTGGGMASGKGGVVDGDGGGVEGGGRPPHPWKPDDAVDVDPDIIKSKLPEFKEMTELHDPEANLRVYEEAWDISQELSRQVREHHMNAIVDGVGDNSVDEVMARVKAFQGAGYDTPRAVYVSTPIEVAIQNAQMRMAGAERKGKLESIRYIPPDVMADVHRHVAQVFPGVLEKWPGELELYDTNTWNAETKSWDAPRLILRKTADGKVEMKDQATYAKVLAVAHSRDIHEAADTPSDGPIYIPFEWPGSLPLRYEGDNEVATG